MNLESFFEFKKLGIHYFFIGDNIFIVKFHVNNVYIQNIILNVIFYI